MVFFSFNEELENGFGFGILVSGHFELVAHGMDLGDGAIGVLGFDVVELIEDGESEPVEDDARQGAVIFEALLEEVDEGDGVGADSAMEWFCDALHELLVEELCLF